MKVFVIAPAGLFLTAYGGRAYGEEFDLPDEVAQTLLARGEVSETDPTKTSPRRKTKEEEVIPNAS